MALIMDPASATCCRPFANHLISFYWVFNNQMGVFNPSYGPMRFVKALMTSNMQMSSIIH